MKNSDMKVIAIILSIALFFTIVTSNAVSIASVVMLVKDNGTAASGTANEGEQAGNNGDATVDNSGNGNATVDNSGSGNATADNSTSGSGSDASGSGSGSGSTGSNASGSGSGSGASGSGNASNSNGSSNGGSTNNGAANNSGSSNNAGAATGALKNGEETYNFYKKACLDIKNNAVAGFTRKEWQEVKALNLGNDKLKDLLASFMTSEADAEEKVNAKGSDDAKNRFAPCGAPFDKVKSATCEAAGNDYMITIVMKTEVNPKKGSNGVASMATGILYMEDVENTIATDGAVKILVKGLNKGEITYEDYTIKAKMTKDGKFIDLSHYVEGKIVADVALIVGSIAGDGVLAFNSHWYSFKY